MSTSWQPTEVLEISKGGNYASDLIESSINLCEVTTDSANTLAQFATFISGYLMDFINWCNAMAPTLYDGKTNYNGMGDPGMNNNPSSNQIQQTSTVISVFNNDSQNVQTIEKNIATTTAQDSSSNVQEEPQILQNGDLSSLLSSVATLLSSLG